MAEIVPIRLATPEQIAADIADLKARIRAVEASVSSRLGTTEQIAVDIADLRARMKVVEEVVCDFREFQKGATEFFTTFRVEEKIKKETDTKRAVIHYSLLSGVITVVSGLTIAVFKFAMTIIPLLAKAHF